MSTSAANGTWKLQVRDKSAGADGTAPADVKVYVDATHEWLGDLELSRVAADLRTYGLKLPSEAEEGGTLQKACSVDAGASAANDTWKLRVEDASEGSSGSLAGWASALCHHINIAW